MSATVALPVKKVNLIVSPSIFAYTVTWNIALPMYGPMGGIVGVSCKPRTADPTNAVSVPEDWSTPPNVTIVVTTAVLPYTKWAVNGRGGGEGEGGEIAGGKGGVGKGCGESGGDNGEGGWRGGSTGGDDGG